jgi:predicted permease
MTGWLWRRLGRGAPEEEVGRELEFHLEMRSSEFEAGGLDGESARAAAAASFGDVVSISDGLVSGRRRRSRGERRREWWSGVGGDVRRAVRLLRRNPGYSVAIVLTLAVGVALVAVWSAVATAYLVKPLPFPESERLVQIEGEGAPDWAEPQDVFVRAVSWDLDVLSIVGDGRPTSVRTSWVTAGWFTASGARPQLGRLFGADEAGRGGAAVAVIGHALWQTRWGGDPGVIGATFTAYSSDRPEESEVFTIIGVLEPDFWFLNGYTEVLVPLRVPRAAYMATLRPGVTLSDAESVLRRQAEARDPAAAEVRLRYAQDAYVERVRPVVNALGGAVGLVLAIALGNALSLVLVRVIGREHEFAVRAAIGAGRGRIARQLLAEGLVLSVVASVAGVMLARVTVMLTRDMLPLMLGTGVPGGSETLSIGGALGFPLFACVTIGAVLAFAPLLSVWRPGLLSALREGRRGTASKGRQRARSALVAVELALSLSLTVGAGLLLRSALYLDDRPLGFDPAGIAALSVALRQNEFPDAAVRADLFARMESAIERDLPGMEASMVGWAPLARSWSLPVETPEQPGEGDDAATAFATVASSDYFTTLSIPLVAGRAFGPDDSPGSEPVAIVSRSLAERLWPGRSAVGGRIRIAPGDGMMRTGPAVWRTVVGVVPDVIKTLTTENPPDLYYAVAQAPPMFVEIVLKDATGPVRLDAVREAIWRIHADVPLDDVRWLDRDVAVATLPSRFLAWLVTAFGVFALVLAAVGMYGVVAYAVSHGRREVAIRMAMGATGGRVARAFVSRQAAWIGTGLLAGLAGGWALSGMLRSQLYGVSAGDPATWLGATLAVGGVALLATWLPARTAARLEPGRLLHGE